MNKKEIKHFLDTKPYKQLSPASLEYNLYLMPEAETIANALIAKMKKKTDEDIELELRIQNASEPEEFIRLMRKSLSSFNKKLLRTRMLENESVLLPFIQRTSLTNRQDFFIENALHFFLHSEGNYCDWIVEHYDDFKSEYLKSMLCLVLGFRGDESLIPMLMSEADRFERDYPNDDYEQGPIFAVQELAVRFLN